MPTPPQWAKTDLPLLQDQFGCLVGSPPSLHEFLLGTKFPRAITVPEFGMQEPPLGAALSLDSQVGPKGLPVACPSPPARETTVLPPLLQAHQPQWTGLGFASQWGFDHEMG